MTARTTIGATPTTIGSAPTTIGATPTTIGVARSVIGAARSRPCTLVVCRGCCCGDPRTYPDYDHEGQLARLQAAAADSGGRIAVRTTDCLGPCDQANVIVVQPSGEGRRRGGRSVWIGWSMGDDCTEEILGWAHAGGPGVTPPPAALELQFVQSSGERTRTRTRIPRRPR